MPVRTFGMIYVRRRATTAVIFGPFPRALARAFAALSCGCVCVCLYFHPHQNQNQNPRNARVAKWPKTGMWKNMSAHIIITQSARATFGQQRICSAPPNGRDSMQQVRDRTRLCCTCINQYTGPGAESKVSHTHKCARFGRRPSAI